MLFIIYFSWESKTKRKNYFNFSKFTRDFNILTEKILYRQYAKITSMAATKNKKKITPNKVQ